MMPGLLVSVRDADETEIALAGGVDLLDVKEPLRGSLGAASPQVWREVLRRCGGRVPASAALGELDEAEQFVSARELAEFDFAKVGLARCRSLGCWPDRWAQLLGRLPRRVTPVAVVYADWQACDAPAPQDVIREAIRLGCGAVLFDTCRKNQGDLFSHLSGAELTSWIAHIRLGGARVVLAGSLGPSSIAAAIDLQPDYVAVRGAVCLAERSGTIDLARVRELRALLGGPRS